MTKCNCASAKAIDRVSNYIALNNQCLCSYPAPRRCGRCEQIYNLAQLKSLLAFQTVDVEDSLILELMVVYDERKGTDGFNHLKEKVVAVIARHIHPQQTKPCKCKDNILIRQLQDQIQFLVNQESERNTQLQSQIDDLKFKNNNLKHTLGIK